MPQSEFNMCGIVRDDMLMKIGLSQNALVLRSRLENIFDHICYAAHTVFHLLKQDKSQNGRLK